ncbi:bifunctional diguanylate cyclase/phosphodiesterase [Fusibacter ferrireducens]|uniref:EAL domain-containing protein n=1 Tax=Fusibacter ferrireducens TaxID=2785058 RepID=A0ABR9ZQZ0_9FIRM|nr:GGDEF domain-containing phosphodiesterase [Fusibacter ferrireducens]MBF4692751.1 EAL domain-containing protein [Fusibacter ferrireducens]
MKKIFFRMIVILLLFAILGVSLNLWGLSTFVSEIEEIVYKRDMAYIDQVFNRLDIILTLVSGEIQKSNVIESEINENFTKYKLEVIQSEIDAEGLYLFGKNFNRIESTVDLSVETPFLDMVKKNRDHFSKSSNVNNFGYYLNPTDHKIKIVSQQYFESSEVYILEVHDLIQTLLIHYPVAVYESLYPYLLNVSSEYIDHDTQFTVDFIGPDELIRAKDKIDLSKLKEGHLIKIKASEYIYVYQLVSLNQNKWLARPLLLKTILYERSGLSNPLKQMFRYVIYIILVSIFSASLIYYKFIYKGLIRKIAILNKQIEKSESDQSDFFIDQTGISEVDAIIAAYKKLKVHLNEREQFIAEMAYFDTITGAGNIYLLERDLDLLLGASDKNEYISLVFIYLKNDREIVEQLTNENIQMFLSTFMTQIRTAFGSDAVYRTADYTFAALSNLNSEYGIIEQVQKLQEYMNARFPNIDIELSIIIARYPEHGESGAELISNIEIASHSNLDKTIIFYSQKLKEVYQKQLQLENDLKRALKNNEIYVVYQPVVNPFTFRIEGVEALVRWKNKMGQLISPEIFIPVAEKLGIIEDIDKMVFEKSCRMLLLWEEIFESDFFVSINTSPIWFTAPNFIKFVHDTIRSLDVNPSKICLEIIETCLIEDIDQANGIILDAKNLGVKIALDDFGKGYSSLNYLRNLKIDKLKIDKDFLLEMDFENKEYNLMDSIVDMAHHMNFQVVVEGVEEIPQLEYLKTLNVELIQGYLFSKPLDKKEITQLLLEGGICNPQNESQQERAGQIDKNMLQ